MHKPNVYGRSHVILYIITKQWYCFGFHPSFHLPFHRQYSNPHFLGSNSIALCIHFFVLRIHRCRLHYCRWDQDNYINPHFQRSPVHSFVFNSSFFIFIVFVFIIAVVAFTCTTVSAFSYYVFPTNVLAIIPPFFLH